MTNRNGAPLSRRCRFEPYIEKLDDELLESVCGTGMMGVVGVAVSFASLPCAIASFGCTVAACCYAHIADSARKDGDEAKYAKNIQSSKDCGIASSVLLAVPAVALPLTACICGGRLNGGLISAAA